MTPLEGRVAEPLPSPVESTLHDFESAFGIWVRLCRPGLEADASSEVDLAQCEIVYESDSAPGGRGAATATVTPRDGPPLILEVSGLEGVSPEALSGVLASALDRAFEAAREVRFFTFELSERYEEINLLYSISETLGSILGLDEAAAVILQEVCDVLGARRGSLWTHSPERNELDLTASVGQDGMEGPLSVDDPDTLTATVFREGRSVIATRKSSGEDAEGDAEGESFLSVPIRYTPPAGESRTVGVVNLIGRGEGERFSAADQKLLSAIASQIGAALENNRLIQESLSKERMAKEMELAHDLQMKLLPDLARFDGAEAAGQVSPAEQVGGDFYQLFKLADGKVGVMLGDVSSHGFPSALIMTLAMSAAGIYAREHDSPARVLSELDKALRDELETTEMFITAFYCVVDPASGTLTYSNAGHPHAFTVRPDGQMDRLSATDPPVGFAVPDSYEQRQVAWETGADLLLLFTDGLSDTLSSGDDNDGEDRVLETVRTCRGCAVGDIVDELFALELGVDSPIHADDRTALLLRL